MALKIKVRKEKQVKIMDLWKHSETGVLPQPTPGRWKEIKLEYELRIKMAEYMGKSLKAIEKAAKEDYDIAFEFSVDLANGWNSRCEPSRKYAFISKRLPDMNKYERFDRLIIQFENDNND